MYGLRPIYDFVDLDYTAQVKKIKESMFVIFNRARGMLLVMDRDITGTVYQFMRVQEPDGTPRPFDERTLETIRKSVQRGPDVRKIIQELDEIDNERITRVDKEADELTYGLMDDLKWAGREVVSSVVWRDRAWKPTFHSTETREAIRAVAG